jgi:hypothetical protein
MSVNAKVDARTSAMPINGFMEPNARSPVTL